MIMYMTFPLIYTVNRSFVKAAMAIGLEIDSYRTYLIPSFLDSLKNEVFFNSTIWLSNFSR